MRIAGELNMGYYPTSYDVISSIEHVMCVDDENGKVLTLDPCCGSGEFCEFIRYKYRYEFIGVELDQKRFETAENILDTAINGDALNDIVIDEGIVSLLFLNPPYNSSDTKDRLEIQFLKKYRTSLCEDGVLVYIVPHYIVKGELAELLVSGFQDLQVMEYRDSMFKQVVIFGTKRKRLLTVNVEELNNLLQNIENPRDYYDLTEVNVPPRPEKALNGYKFHSKGMDPKALERDLAQSKAYDRLGTSINAMPKSIARPPCELHSGHLGLLLASGYIDGVIGSGDSTHLVKSKCIKSFSKSSSFDDDGNPVVITKELFETSLKILTPQGDLKILGKAPETTTDENSEDVA